MGKLIVILLCTLFIVGCNNPQSMEEVFHSEMKRSDNVQDYNIVEVVEEDNVIVFTSETNTPSIDPHPKLAYYKDSESGWSRSLMAVCRMDGWVASKTSGAESAPYMMCGTLTEPRFQEVMVDNGETNLVELDDGFRRVWYTLSEQLNVEIKVKLTDGTEELLKKE